LNLGSDSGDVKVEGYIDRVRNISKSEIGEVSSNKSHVEVVGISQLLPCLEDNKHSRGRKEWG
jgi:hypothetical protein